MLGFKYFRCLRNKERIYFIFLITFLTVLIPMTCHRKNLISEFLSRIEQTKLNTDQTFQGDTLSKNEEDESPKKEQKMPCLIPSSGLSFTAFGINFEIILITPEDEFFTHDAVAIIYDEKEVKPFFFRDLDIKMILGYVKDHTESTVFGYCNDNVISMVVYHNNTTYFFESKMKYYKNDNDKETLIAYRDSDFRFPVCLNETDERLCFKREKHKDMVEIEIEKKKVDNLIKNLGNTEAKRRKKNLDFRDKVCLVEAVSDHTFYESNDKSVARTIGEILFMIKYASNIFANTDFEGSGIKDNFRLMVRSISIYTSKNSRDYFWYQVGDRMSSALNGFSNRPQLVRHCLSFLFLSRKFHYGELGEAYAATPYNRLVGVCGSGYTHEMHNISYNVGVVTNLNSRGKRMPLVVTALTTAHEMGHSCGSKHDPKTPECKPGGSTGYYLMYGGNLDGSKQNHKQFSPCSKRSIAEVLRSRGTCLIPYSYLKMKENEV